MRSLSTPNPNISKNPLRCPVTMVIFHLFGDVDKPPLTKESPLGRKEICSYLPPSQRHSPPRLANSPGPDNLLQFVRAGDIR